MLKRVSLNRFGGRLNKIKRVMMIVQELNVKKDKVKGKVKQKVNSKRPEGKI